MTASHDPCLRLMPATSLFIFLGARLEYPHPVTKVLAPKCLFGLHSVPGLTTHMGGSQIIVPFFACPEPL